MLACRRRGLIVLTDRYPQDQIPGAYDGTVFPPNVEGGRFVSWLASQERKAFHWMASHKPDLVIKLNVSWTWPARVSLTTKENRWKGR